VAVTPNPVALPTGASLQVQATVSADKKYVTMNLTPAVTELLSLARFNTSGGVAGGAAQDTFIQLPETQLQMIQTTVSVPDGGTLLFGGMKKTAEIDTEAGVPILSKIPVLKRLYSNRTLVKDEQVLLILVKPTIIIQSEMEDRAFPTFGEDIG
jgi:type II secretory pathway component GspD/PulD (secretin)